MRDEVVRKKVFPMLTWLIIVMSLSAYTVSKALMGVFGLKVQSYAEAILLNPWGLIGVTILYFVTFFIAYLTAKIKILNVITATIFSLVMGAGIFSTTFYVADTVNAQIIPEALILTAGIFVIAVIFQLVTKKDLSHWTWWLLFLLLVAIGLTVAEIFVHASWFRIAVDLGVVLLFVFITMYDMFIIREKMKDDEWMLGVLNFFLDFANILIRIIVLLIELYAQSS
ncbi:MAG: Bax inhibitor-1 family protein [Candidatus Asgardarchaeia archaeon]